MAYHKSKPLSSKEVWLLERTIVDFLGEDFCRFCNLCRPCDVHGWSMSQPGILKTMIYENAFHLDMEETYKGYKKNSLDCEGCDNLCSKRCPFGIDIKEAMKKVHNYFGG